MDLNAMDDVNCEWTDRHMDADGWKPISHLLKQVQKSITKDCVIPCHCKQISGIYLFHTCMWPGM